MTQSIPSETGRPMSAPSWPALRVDSWVDTRETLHRWLQIVGKIQLVSTPLVNHFWNSALQLSARGLRTSLMHEGDLAFDAEFDFVDHQFVIRLADGKRATVVLEPKSVAQFWSEVQAALGSLGLVCTIVPSPNEIDPATPFAEDTQHASYDPVAANAFWRQLSSVGRVFAAWRAGFAGKDSPVQLFWGSLDLSIVRYSGRVAPAEPPSHVPHLPAWVMVEAESRENASAGFWAGGGQEGAFYAYAFPEPPGYRDAKLPVGHYDASFGEWILPYEDVRTSADPDKTLLEFLEGTYGLAADLGRWDRASLDVDPHRLDVHLYRGADRTTLY
ncbi:MAG: DUF5996 family protein [Propionibacteriaceae bacterium]